MNPTGLVRRATVSVCLGGLVLLVAASVVSGVLYEYPLAELMDPQFATEPWEPGMGTLDSRALLPGDIVQFTLTLGNAALSGKTGVGDDWAISPSAGLGWDGGYLPGDPGDPHASPHSNVNIFGYSGITMPVRYVSGPGPISMKLFMNTGMTGPSAYPANDTANNTGWSGVEQTLSVGSQTNLLLDFGAAKVWAASDNPYPHSGFGEAWANDTWHAINERDLREVTNMGFEVYGPAGALIVLAIIPEPGSASLLVVAACLGWGWRRRGMPAKNGVPQ